MQTHRFAQTAFHTISHHCVPERLRDGESDFGSVRNARDISGIGAFITKRREVRARKAGTLVINFAEIGAAKNSGGLWKPETGRRPNLRNCPICLSDLFRVTNVAFVAHGQLVAALCPTAGKDIAAVLCFHALAEAMSLGSLPIIRLKRTFWHC
jgi:hypothetical protein